MLTIEEFLRLSNRLREYYGKQIKDRFAEYTFSPNEISILILLQNNNSITTSTQLRVVLGVSKALVSRSVTSLEQKGLITVKGIPNDKRISHIELTENAIPVLEKINVEICSKCHPFYTGKQKLVDTGGRVEKFRKRFGMDK